MCTGVSRRSAADNCELRTCIGPYVAARIGFEPTTLTSKGFDSTNAPLRPTGKYKTNTLTQTHTDKRTDAGTGTHTCMQAHSGWRPRFVIIRHWKPILITTPSIVWRLLTLNSRSLTDLPSSTQLYFRNF